MINEVVVCSLAAKCESNCLLARTMDGRIMRCGTYVISSCQSAATFEIAKRFWPRVSHVKARTERTK